MANLAATSYGLCRLLGQQHGTTQGQSHHCYHLQPQSRSVKYWSPCQGQRATLSIFPTQRRALHQRQFFLWMKSWQSYSQPIMWEEPCFSPSSHAQHIVECCPTLYQIFVSWTKCHRLRCLCLCYRPPFPPPCENGRGVLKELRSALRCVYHPRPMLMGRMPAGQVRTKKASSKPWVDLHLVLMQHLLLEALARLQRFELASSQPREQSS